MIRSAIPHDFSRIAEIYNLANYRFFDIYSPEERVIFDEKETPQSVAKSAESRIIDIIENDDGFIVGYISYRKKNKTVVWISSLYIDPHYQGFGYGKQLLDHVVGYAKNNSCQLVVLETHEKASWALDFYKKNSFVDVREKINTFPYSKILDKPPIANRSLLAKLVI